MLKTELKNEISLVLPVGIARKLELKEGDTVEAKVEKGKLIFLRKKDKVSKIMQYAGVWQDEDTDRIFRDVRKGWSNWQKNLSA